MFYQLSCLTVVYIRNSLTFTYKIAFQKFSKNKIISNRLHTTEQTYFFSYIACYVFLMCILHHLISESGPSITISSLKVILKNKYLLQMLRKFLLIFIPSNYKYNKIYKNNSHETYFEELLNKNSFVHKILKAIS